MFVLQIGNINNCDTIAEMIGQMSLKYGKTSTADDEKRCKEITEAAVRMGKEVLVLRLILRVNYLCY